MREAVVSVLAFSTPRYPGEWRWRIVGYTSDDVIEESTTAFPTMTGALAAGQLATDVEDYWTGMENEIVSCLWDNGPMPPGELGDHLRICRGAAVSLIAMLAQDGKVRIGLVELASQPTRGCLVGVRLVRLIHDKLDRPLRVETEHGIRADREARQDRA
jgi:hypothetical protein